MAVCPLHGEQLWHRCPACGREIGWYYPSIVRCACGHDLSGTAHLLVTARSKQAAQDILTLVSEQRPPWLPPAFYCVDRGQVVHAAFRLGLFLSGWKGTHSIEQLLACGPDAVSGVVETATGCLRNWPGRLHEFLASQLAGAVHRPGRFGARRALGAFYDWLTKLPPGPIRDSLASETRQVISSDDVLSRRCHRSQLLSIEQGDAQALSLAEAASVLGVSKETVRRFADVGLLPGAHDDGRGVPMALAADGLRSASLSGWANMSLARAASVLGVSAKIVRSMVDAGVLTPVHSGPKDGWGRWAFRASDVDELLARLLPVATTISAASFNKAVHALGMRGASPGELIQMALDRRLPVSGLDAANTGLKQLIFDQHQLQACCRQISEARGFLTQAATCGRLSLKPEVVVRLVAKGMLEGNAEGISVASVRRFANTYVTGAALAKARKTSPRALAAKLEAAGVLPLVGPRIDGCRQNIYTLMQVDGLQG